MNITKYNFKRQLPFIKQCIEKSDFIAVDFEFSGIVHDENLKNAPEDCMEVIYWKSKSNGKSTINTKNWLRFM